MSEAKKSGPAAEHSSGIPADTVVHSPATGRGMQLHLAAPRRAATAVSLRSRAAADLSRCANRFHIGWLSYSELPVF